jgi:Flp pilus assembly pilin Flp
MMPRLLKTDFGAIAIEYALLGCLISLAGLAAVLLWR